MDESTFDEAKNAPVYGALTRGGALTAQGGPADTRGVVPGLQSSLEQQNKLINDFYAPRVKMYEDLTANLAARRAGPPLSERLAQYSAALAQPTKYSGPGAMLGAISSVYADQQKAQREERLANEDLATKYQMALMGEQENRFDKRMTAAEKMRALQLRYANKGQGKPGRLIVQPDGTLRHPYTGQLVDASKVKPDELQYLRENPTPQVVEWFNGRYGIPNLAEAFLGYGGQNTAEEAE